MFFVFVVTFFVPKVVVFYSFLPPSPPPPPPAPVFGGERIAVSLNQVGSIGVEMTGRQL